MCCARVAAIEFLVLLRMHIQRGCLVICRVLTNKLELPVRLSQSVALDHQAWVFWRFVRLAKLVRHEWLLLLAEEVVHCMSVGK